MKCPLLSTVDWDVLSPVGSNSIRPKTWVCSMNMVRFWYHTFTIDPRPIYLGIAVNGLNFSLPWACGCKDKSKGLRLDYTMNSFSQEWLVAQSDKGPPAHSYSWGWVGPSEPPVTISRKKIQGCRFSDFFRPSDFFFFFFFFCACIVCVTTMRANWWLSGQFWLRKSFAPLNPQRGAAPGPRWGLCPQTPGPRILSYFFEQSQWHPWKCDVTSNPCFINMETFRNSMDL